MKSKTSIFSNQKFFLGLLVLIMGYFSFVNQYWKPDTFFWDENYHISSAQKYLHHLYFMEHHPPLGKLLIAAGEALFNPNEKTDQLAYTDWYAMTDEQVVFVGYRFFPVLFAWASSILIYLILLTVSGNPVISFFLSFFYLFDNAMIVHSRSAMLESTLIFFLLCLILTSFSLFQILKDSSKTKQRRQTIFTLSILAGSFLGAAAATKFTGLIGGIFIFPILWALRKKLLFFLNLLTFATIGFLLVFSLTFATHFLLADQTSDKLRGNGYYTSSKEKVDQFLNNKLENLSSIPVFIADNIDFTGSYNQGVTSLDLCDSKDNGSHPFFWPIGARSINYLWQSYDEKTSYLYLQSNPVIWLTVLAGIIASVLVLARKHLLLQNHFKKDLPFFLVILAGYLLYLFLISFIDRVMYLYHYFPALIFGIINLAFLIRIFSFGANQKDSDDRKILTSLFMGLLVFASFQQYKPLTYFHPITDEHIASLAIIDAWDLTCGNCKRKLPDYCEAAD